MHRIVSLSLVALLVIFISCAAYAGQKEVIVALEAVKGSIEWDLGDGVSLIVWFQEAGSCEAVPGVH